MISNWQGIPVLLFLVSLNQLVPTGCPNLDRVETLSQEDLGKWWQHTSYVYERETKQVYVCHEQVYKPLAPSSDFKDYLTLNNFVQTYVRHGAEGNAYIPYHTANCCSLLVSCCLLMTPRYLKKSTS